jgi:energy-coupling factor transporter ATP-binding protein EcfA2
MLVYGPSGSGKSTLAECALALASTTDAILILDDIDLDCNVRQLRRDLDHGLWIVATAPDIPADFAIVGRFPIVLMLNRLRRRPDIAASGRRQCCYQEADRRGPQASTTERAGQ